MKEEGIGHQTTIGMPMQNGPVEMSKLFNCPWHWWQGKQSSVIFGVEKERETDRE